MYIGPAPNYFVKCRSLFCGGSSGDFDHYDTAVDAWNNRVKPPRDGGDE